jgi:hypothetical protein
MTRMVRFTLFLFSARIRVIRGFFYFRCPREAAEPRGPMCCRDENHVFWLGER